MGRTKDQQSRLVRTRTGQIDSYSRDEESRDKLNCYGKNTPSRRCNDKGPYNNNPKGYKIRTR